MSSPLSIQNAHAAYVPTGAPDDAMPRGGDFIESNDNASNETDVAGANSTTGGYLQRMEMTILDGAKFFDTNFVLPIALGLRNIQTNHWHFSAKTSESDATSARNEMKELKRNSYLLRWGKYISQGPNPSDHLVDRRVAFYKHKSNSQRSESGFRGEAAQIEAHIKSNAAGISLLEAAQSFQGSQYRPGMTCNVLIIRAIRQASMDMTTGNTTSIWFNRGLGSDFRQIYGGANGLPLGQLVNDLNNDEVDIPLGSIIVQDGHAAFYAGQIKIQEKWEIITYDANDQSGWTVTGNGAFFRSDSPVPSGNDPGVLMRFPGKQVGEHVTRLQWSHEHLVKVFQPVADPPPEHRF
jgi:hypothetical protein